MVTSTVELVTMLHHLGLNTVDHLEAGLKNGTKVRAYGEENMMMGQDKGYMMGQYDGQQNNHTTRWDYSTDVETNMPAATRPKGHYGTSSGGCCSASASVTAKRAQ